MLEKIDVSVLREIAVEAGNEILKVYNDADFSKVVDFKDDHSPLTLADKESHKVIFKELTEKFPEIPLISEEGQQYEYNERKDWDWFWLVDPLDGTKEFIKRNGEFTVNIALIHKGVPQLGIIYVPVKDIMYWTETPSTAFKMEGDEKSELNVNNRTKSMIAVRSASHASPEEDEVFGKYDIVESISRGSSLKFCMVAEGKADVYYRHGPTMEWDTAAGQAIVQAAGGKMYDASLTKPFQYNKESLLNGSFLCLGQS
ncbi:MAG: 3'(2'),5'-bisphosphate nucleotidase CysQ [Bacteroidota bacterium]